MDGVELFGIWMGVALALLLFFGTGAFIVFAVLSLAVGFVLFISP